MERSYVFLNKPDLLTRLWTDFHNYWYRIFYSQNADISLEKGPNSKREAMRCGLYSQATQASAQDMSVHRLWDSN